MTTTTTILHGRLERGRFAQHALAALTAWLPAAWRSTGATRPTTAALEAAAVREMAYAYSKTDPGFADDLYAAANRHEAQHAPR
ncbi:MAG: hypothetical protein JSR59_02745 [Proteobacteria bacterium]|nr:hypothetical protein [Pseudomonadota bacterium]